MNRGVVVLLVVGVVGGVAWGKDKGKASATIEPGRGNESGGTPPGGEGPWRVYKVPRAEDTEGVEIGRIFRHEGDNDHDRKWSHYVAPSIHWSWIKPDYSWKVIVDPVATRTSSCAETNRCQLLEIEATTRDPSLEGPNDSVDSSLFTVRSYGYHATGLYNVTATIYDLNGSPIRTSSADLYLVAEGARLRRELFCASADFEWPQADRTPTPDANPKDHRVDWRIDWIDNAVPPVFCPLNTVRYEFVVTL